MQQVILSNQWASCIHYLTRWTPLFGPDEEDEGKSPLEIDSEEDFLGALSCEVLAELMLFCLLSTV